MKYYLDYSFASEPDPLTFGELLLKVRELLDKPIITHVGVGKGQTSWLLEAVGGHDLLQGIHVVELPWLRPGQIAVRYAGSDEWEATQ